MEGGRPFWPTRFEQLFSSNFQRCIHQCHLIPSDPPLTFRLYWSAPAAEATSYWKEEFINNYRETGSQEFQQCCFCLSHNRHFLGTLLNQEIAKGSSACQCRWELLCCVVLCKWCFLPLGMERFLGLFL